MNFSIRTLMLNVTYVAIAIGAWCSDSELFLALVTLFFVILILRTVACCVLATENRAYWIGSAILSCGLLLTSPYLLIFDAIANYEDSRRHAAYAYGVVPPTLLPSLPTTVSPSVIPSNPSTAFPSPVSPVTTWTPYIPPTPVGLSFQLTGGYSDVLKAFLVSFVAYFSGAIAGVICSRVCVLPQKIEPS